MEKTRLKMIPCTIGNEYKSNAEKKVFKYLSETELDGYAFHSVGLPEHEKKSYSEADFIVLTRYGILCLEVKGGRVECQNGVWVFEDKYGHRNTKNEGPFDQAAGALFALKSALMNYLPWIKNVSFATGVVFTDINFSYRGVSVIPDIIFDYGYAGSFSEYIKRCHIYWDKKNHREFEPLTDDEIEDIKRFIRDDLHFVPSLHNVINTIDEELVRLTEEQISLLDSLEDNRRIIVNGPAGSGKTLLAFQYAKKYADQGKRVLYLVYNKALAKHLSGQPGAENISIKHFHGLISDYIPIDSNRINDSTYFSNTLPDLFGKYLSSHRMALYDVLIVDEGQDLISLKNLTVFDLLLKNNLFGGNWVVFYDKNQNLFSSAKFNKGYDKLLSYKPAYFRLTRNCRNTEPIARFNKCCSNIDCGKPFVPGEVVETKEYFLENFSEILDSIIDSLIDANILIEEITIISPLMFKNSVMNFYTGKYLEKIENFDGSYKNGVLNYASIQSFKGLDSKIVIALDLQRLIENDDKIMLYTLLSRARTLLYLLLPQEISNQVINRVIINMGKESV